MAGVRANPPIILPSKLFMKGRLQKFYSSKISSYMVCQEFTQEGASVQSQNSRGRGGRSWCKYPLALPPLDIYTMTVLTNTFTSLTHMR